MIIHENLTFASEFIDLMKQKRKVRIPEKETLDIYEASVYTGIGVKRLSEMANKPYCNFVIWVGPQRLFIRTKLEEYLLSHSSV